MDNVPDDLAPFYDLESLEQFRAIADELRLRILDLLTQQALTVTQVGERLGIAPAKAHYHVRELERVGLVRLVATRENRGILEKYYRVVARELRVPGGLLQRMPADEAISANRQFLDYLTRGYLAAVARRLRDGGDNSGSNLLSSSIWATDEEMRELTARVGELIKPYDHPRDTPGEFERIFAQITYTPEAGAVGTDTTGDAPPVVRAEEDSRRAAPVRHSRRSQRAFAAGTISYARADLERRMARGYQLDIYALGTVIFADDVTAELAERVIGRFRLKGALIAPPGVREVLERKQQQEGENAE